MQSRLSNDASLLSLLCKTLLPHMSHAHCRQHCCSCRASAWLPDPTDTTSFSEPSSTAWMPCCPSTADATSRVCSDAFRLLFQTGTPARVSTRHSSVLLLPPLGASTSTVPCSPCGIVAFTSKLIASLRNAHENDARPPPDAMCTYAAPTVRAVSGSRLNTTRRFVPPCPQLE
jgi:hypothetical protein